ncbi:hypothetical protein [Psychrosphaera saromensis]|nr:hypothetical protein [Psychrosphaera saromensis]
MFNKIDTLLFFILGISAFPTFSSNKSIPIEVGIGVEYGGAGSQIFLPASNQKFNSYVTVGVVSAFSENENTFIVSGVGVNFRLNRQSTWGLYSGILGTESHFNINDESLIERQKVSLYGLSVNYKHKILKSNFYLGASYNIYSEGTYPMITFSYKY